MEKSKKDLLAYDVRSEKEQAKHPRPQEIQTTPEIEQLGKLKQQAKERIDRLQKEDKARIAKVKEEIPPSIAA
jgi:hypothetical protein